MIKISHRDQLLNVLWEIQNSKGYIDRFDLLDISEQLGVSTIEIEGVVSFYHFFHQEKGGKYQIYLNNSLQSEFSGYKKIKEAFEKITGVRTGVRKEIKSFSIQETACIGLSDVEPSCLIDFYPFTNLTVSKVNRVISLLKAGMRPSEICDHPLSDIFIHTRLNQGILFGDYHPGNCIKKLTELDDLSILDALKQTGLSGMGGAFYPVHLKWASCRNEENTEKYIVCNADEGEPGTFKDRCLIQRRPGLILEGMIIAAYVTGSQNGIIYLRAEYKYLLDQIQHHIDLFQKNNWLGRDILGIEGFHFSVRIQLGAGAYICGEETALLESMEGYRGEPRAKVFFPTQKGFKLKPTVVNNVETFCAAAKVIELGFEKYCEFGIKKSYGTKLLSVSGDCKNPGVYEIEWGITLKSLLELVGAEDAFAVQLSGPSGEICFEEDWNRTIDLLDLKCGGAVSIFNHNRNLFDILQNYNDFFIHESCGVCTPCRAGTFILKKEIEQLKLGLSDFQSYKNIYQWSKILTSASRCGLGKSAPNSLIQAMDKKPEFFSDLIAAENLISPRFDLQKSIIEYDSIIKQNE